MADPASELPERAHQSAAVLGHLSRLDRFLPLWILLAIAGVSYWAGYCQAFRAH